MGGEWMSRGAACFAFFLSVDLCANVRVSPRDRFEQIVLSYCLRNACEGLPGVLQEAGSLKTFL